MKQSRLLVGIIKKQLKARNLTYADVADCLKLSEASVKRMFSECHFTLDRLENICDLMDVSISEIVKAMDAELEVVNQLSHAQEAELVADNKLLLVSFLVINGWTFTDIQKHYKLTEHQTVQYLSKLDRLKIIELLPKNRIKLLVSSKFTWIKNGPIQSFFKSQLERDFLQEPFDQSVAKHEFMIAMLSMKSAEQLANRIEQLSKDFRELNLKDSHLPKNQKEVYSMLAAFSAWKPHAFDVLRR